MVKELLKDITGYFDLLLSQGYYVAFHNLFIPLQSFMGELTPYNINLNPYCLLVKSSQQAWAHCIERQSKVMDACTNGVFCGICYAGMGEYVFPIKNKEGQTLAFISVSGYRIRPQEAYQRMDRVARKYGLSSKELLETYRQNLRDDVPEKEALIPLIMPLCRMFELLNLLLSDMSMDGVENISRSSILSHAVVYLRRNYAHSISIEDVAGVCHCSPSTLSHMFKKELGSSIREYIRKLRMADAVQLLKNTELQVNSIGDMLGYANPNYFCSVFSKEMGCSPTAFRQRCQKKQEDYHSMEAGL